MAVRKIVVRKGEVLAAFKVAASVAFGFVAFCGGAAVAGQESIVMYPAVGYGSLGKVFQRFLFPSIPIASSG